MTLALRLVNAAIAPSDLFSNPRVSPPWFPVLLVATLVTAAAPYALLNSERGHRIADDRKAEAVERWRGQIPEERLKVIETASPAYEFNARMLALKETSTLVFSVLVWAAITHFVFAVMFLKTEVTFQPVLSVFSHAAVVWMLGNVFTAALSYVTMQPVVGTSVASLIPSVAWPPPTTFVGFVVRSTDLFLLWWIPVVAVGLGRVYRTSPWKIAAGFAAFHLVLILVPAVFLRPSPPTAGGPLLRSH